MKFSVGLQNKFADEIIDSVIKHSGSISEVYFSYPHFANGRSPQAEISLTEFNEKLERLRNIPLNILFNAMCYGEDTLSRNFYNNIGNLLDELSNKFYLKTVTTTSPIIAKFVKQNFAKIEVRASVNMEIGSIEGMDYLSKYFDSFYAKRELNRNFKALKMLRQWCDANGKGLYGLANSGCLNNCSAHIFHDNLVAHEGEILKKDNAYDFEGQCYTYLGNNLKRQNWLKITNFIRPEDISLYENFFDGIKLATRVNQNPKKIINAYLGGNFSGNLPEILEPNHSTMFYPFVIENKKIPKDFAEKVGNCSHQCENCGYCGQVLNAALVNLG